MSAFDADEDADERLQDQVEEILTYHEDASPITSALHYLAKYLIHEAAGEPHSAGFLFLCRLESALIAFPEKHIPSDPFGDGLVNFRLYKSDVYGTSLHDAWVRAGWRVFEGLLCNAGAPPLVVRELEADPDDEDAFVADPQSHAIFYPDPVNGAYVRVLDTVTSSSHGPRWSIRPQGNRIESVFTTVQAIFDRVEGSEIRFQLAREARQAQTRIGFTLEMMLEQAMPGVDEILRHHLLDRSELVAALTQIDSATDDTDVDSNHKQVYEDDWAYYCDDQLYCSPTFEVVIRTSDNQEFDFPEGSCSLKIIKHMILVTDKKLRTTFTSSELRRKSDSGDDTKAIVQFFRSGKRNRAAWDNLIVGVPGERNKYTLSLRPLLDDEQNI
ncbi:hypothetical protein [Limnoglobus roseus]|uniref:Uncharacterized protein n=1 Tax=Limnoglobus roseus TaxID=2598579 RepID=A0A5C1AIF1_9BACT|nr:hypothetical protein [Limnoglobus roseus]QEL18620.1 hypothetical protein PX52LOC_05653 [Limnoglobus roseus]